MHLVGQRSSSAARLLALLLCFVCLGLLSTASGCRSKASADAKKKLEELKKKEKPKPNFDSQRVYTEPNEKASVTVIQKKVQTATDEKPVYEEQVQDELIVRAMKPGHWTGVLVETRANNFDFAGEMISIPEDNQANPLDLERSPFRLLTKRPVALPKGQRKTLETLFFSPPPPENHVRSSTWMDNRLYGNRGGGEQWRWPGGEILPHMPSFQYFMVVLSRDPNRYRYLRVLDTVRPPAEFLPTNPDDTAYFRVLVPRVSGPLALPTQPLCWTSTAYVVWDDILPGALTPEQQQSMIDWLHWGGGLIVSGPQTLDALRGSFLEPYLAATAVETTKLTNEAFQPLNEHWTLPDEKGQKLPLQVASSWSGVKLAKHPQAEFLTGTGELIAERRVGRGRVVVTAFRLGERDLINWRSFDSFVNGGLLRRPQRRYDSLKSEFNFVNQLDRFDANLTTNVRYYSRDALDPEKTPAPPSQVAEAAADASVPQMPGAYIGASETDVITALKSRPGVAAWNDFSWVSSGARTTLRKAAGISVPKREFVVWMLGIYLVLIVPVNWLVFRLLGRIEWAWIAVPVVALGWGLAVIWLAQLDIGFARAEREVAVLEVQNGYSRAHLTRYTALYSSLSTSYDIHFDDPTAVAQPFSPESDMLRGQTSSTVTLRSLVDHALTGFPVSSNSTGMIHSEQMFGLGGTLDWHTPSEGAATLENNTKWKLQGVAILRRATGVSHMAWLGDLVPGAKVEVNFEPHDKQRLTEWRNGAPLTAKNDAPDAGLNLRSLIEQAQELRTLGDGDVRLVAYLDDGLPGMRVTPAAAQARRATLVIANLQFGPSTLALPDRNLRTKVILDRDLEALQPKPEPPAEEEQEETQP